MHSTPSTRPVCVSTITLSRKRRLMRKVLLRDSGFAASSTAFIFPSHWKFISFGSSSAAAAGSDMSASATSARPTVIRCLPSSADASNLDGARSLPPPRRTPPPRPPAIILIPCRGRAREYEQLLRCRDPAIGALRLGAEALTRRLVGVLLLDRDDEVDAFGDPARQAEMERGAAPARLALDDQVAAFIGMDGEVGEIARSPHIAAAAPLEGAGGVFTRAVLRGGKGMHLDAFTQNCLGIAQDRSGRGDAAGERERQQRRQKW